MLLALCLQGSILVAPVYLTDEPPDSRALRTIVVAHGERSRPVRTRAEAAERAASIAGKLREGADFEELARSSSNHPSAVRGGVLGTFCPGMLAPPLDKFLFQAEEGEMSQPIETEAGFHVAQRIERDAGCLQILVGGTGDEAQARAAKLLERLRAGESFAELAREVSDDPASAARGGQLALFQRGSEDSLIKAAAFRARVGEVIGPVESPLGLHILKRVEPSAIDPDLAEDVFARVRAILVAFDGAAGADPALRRTHAEAQRLAQDLAERIRAGEDMAVLAREHDDSGARERGGDQGWVRRRTSAVPEFFDRLFKRPRGELIGPVASTAGWVILRREDGAAADGPR
ncbi:MAG TPA: peptidylprolyl isomerase [Planctomycetota bacterium]|nr:peptidylprolyl isomerase [Planctomycetota bacterium]